MRKRPGFFTLLAYMSSLASFLQSADNLPLPDVQDLHSIAFWATSYWIHHANAAETGIPLRDLAGNALGPILTKSDWCSSALEGTVRVGEVTYNYAGTAKKDFVDCSAYFKPIVGYSRFSAAKGPFGDGVAGCQLVPYRTVAADPAFLKSGTVIFVPSAVGEKLPNGEKHDGYFFVGDAGGAIKGNHLDIFQGDQPAGFSFIRSRNKPLYKAFIVTDPHSVEVLKRMHKPLP
jgi:3D (Asp-Asp-Asp) domain-containing protein